jgi:hypothetical protein
MGFTIIGGGNGGGSPLSVESGDSTFENVNTLVLPEGFATESEAGVVELLASVAANPSGGLPLSMFLPSVIHAYDMGGSGAPISDLVGEMDLTTEGTVLFEQDGINGDAIGVSADASLALADLSAIDLADTDPFCMTWWHYTTDASPSTRAIVDFRGAAGAARIVLSQTNGTTIAINWYNAAGSGRTLNGVAMTVPAMGAAWSLFGLTLLGNQMQFWVNGVLRYAATGDLIHPANLVDMRFLRAVDGNTGLNAQGRGRVDEVTIWNAALGPRAHEELYSDGSGRFFPDFAAA